MDEKRWNRKPLTFTGEMYEAVGKLVLNLRERLHRSPEARRSVQVAKGDLSMLLQLARLGMTEFDRELNAQRKRKAKAS